MKTTRATLDRSPQNRFFPNGTNINFNRLVLTGDEMKLEQPMVGAENKNSHRSGSIIKQRTSTIFIDEALIFSYGSLAKQGPYCDLMFSKEKENN
jgi:hypothetical protein